jgi:hypothetical protein
MSKSDIYGLLERLRGSTIWEWEAGIGWSVGVAASEGGSSRVELTVTVKDCFEAAAPSPCYRGIFRAPRTCATSSGQV